MIQRKSSSNIVQRKSFTQDEISDLRRQYGDVMSADNEIQWLLSKKAIRVKTFPSGSWNITVLQYPDGSIPYTELSDLWLEASRQVSKKYFAQQKQAEEYENQNLAL